ncbi:MAG TPA: TIM barrel protein [Chitinophagaceae bacterium]|nr:TIM barrel protein [Chitinophagaceae bacterium]
MKRRSFIQQGLVAGTSTLFANSIFGSENRKHLSPAPPFKMDYAFHDGMFKNNGGANFVDQIQFAYDNGFRSIEDNGMMGRTVEEQKKIADKLSGLGMRMGVFVVAYDNWPLQTSLTSGKTEWKDKFLKACTDAVEVAKRCKAKWMTVVPGNYDRSLSMDYQTANVVDILRRGAAIFEPHGLIMVLEPLSDTPDLFLRRSDQTFLICQAVNSPSCKILFDMYHMQRNEGNIINNMNKAWDQIAYFQIGDNPGRKEPGTGEMNYRNIFKHIYDKGYRGVMGMEHGNAKPGKEGEQALMKAYREADSF